MQRLFLGSACVLAVFTTATPVAAQSQTVFQDDFEAGLGAWTMEAWPLSSVPGWHLSEDGECGVSITRMVALGQNCSYGKASFSEDTLISPSFTLPDSIPLFVMFDVIWDMDIPSPAENVVGVTLQNLTKDWGHGQDFMFVPQDAGKLSTVCMAFYQDASWAGDMCELRLEVVTDTVGNLGSGLHVDNVRIVTNASSDLGLVEPHGPEPAGLWWQGPLTTGSQNGLTAFALPAASPGLLVVGLALAPSATHGVLVNPAPMLVVPLVTPPQQQPPVTDMFWAIDDSILPPATSIYLQLLTLHTSVWSASNTLVVTSP